MIINDHDDDNFDDLCKHNTQVAELWDWEGKVPSLPHPYRNRNKASIFTFSGGENIFYYVHNLQYKPIA